MSDPMNSGIYEQASQQAEMDVTREHAVDDAVHRLLSAQASDLDKRDLRMVVAEIAILRDQVRTHERTLAIVADSFVGKLSR